MELQTTERLKNTRAAIFCASIISFHRQKYTKRKRGEKKGGKPQERIPGAFRYSEDRERAASTKKVRKCDMQANFAFFKPMHEIDKEKFRASLGAFCPKCIHNHRKTAYNRDEFVQEINISEHAGNGKKKTETWGDKILAMLGSVVKSI